MRCTGGAGAGFTELDVSLKHVTVRTDVTVDVRQEARERNDGRCDVLLGPAPAPAALRESATITYCDVVADVGHARRLVRLPCADRDAFGSRKTRKFTSTGLTVGFRAGLHGGVKRAAVAEGTDRAVGLGRQVPEFMHDGFQGVATDGVGGNADARMEAEKIADVSALKRDFRKRRLVPSPGTGLAESDRLGLALGRQAVDQHQNRRRIDVSQ